MTKPKIVSINKNKDKADQRKAELLEVLEEIRKQVESGELQELVATSLTIDGTSQIHVSCVEFHTGVGLFEIGKTLFISQVMLEDE